MAFKVGSFCDVCNKVITDEDTLHTVFRNLVNKKGGKNSFLDVRIVKEAIKHGFVINKIHSAIKYEKDPAVMRTIKENNKKLERSDIDKNEKMRLEEQNRKLMDDISYAMTDPSLTKVY